MDADGRDAQARLRLNVQELMDFCGKTQVELARYLKLSQPHVSNLLSGVRPWQIEHLDKLATFFRVTVPSLFNEGHGNRDRRIYQRRSGVERRQTPNSHPDRRQPGRPEITPVKKLA